MVVKSWNNRKKLSTAFLLDNLGPHNLWTSAEQKEAMCLTLALPSITCMDLQDQKVGPRTVDK